MKKLQKVWRDLNLHDIDAWSRCLRPGWFFLGVVLAFLTCCLAGAACSRTSTFSYLPRFNIFTSPYTDYYPTANQMITYVTTHARPEQTVVIVGGNSVFKGFGQKLEDLWTIDLAKELGDRYFVANFAFEGTGPFEGGYWAAEALAKKGLKVIFVTDSEPNEVGMPIGYLLTSMFFDFRNRQLLMDFPAREAYLNQLRVNERNFFSHRISEIDLGKNIDRLTNASDLWNWISYHWFSTIWTEYTETVLPPRKAYKNWSPAPPDMQFQRLNGFCRELVQTEEQSAEQDSHGHYIASVRGWFVKTFDASVMVAPALRDHCTIFFPRINSRIIGMMSSDEAERHEALFGIGIEKWRKLGIEAMVLGDDFVQSDYRDIKHFSIEGGRKVARIVARQVHVMGRRLGYEK